MTTFVSSNRMISRQHHAERSHLLLCKPEGSASQATRRSGDMVLRQAWRDQSEDPGLRRRLSSYWIFPADHAEPGKKRPRAATSLHRVFPRLVTREGRAMVQWPHLFSICAELGKGAKESPFLGDATSQLSWSSD